MNLIMPNSKMMVVFSSKGEDINGDGVVNIADLQGIANIAVGLNWDGSVPQNNARRFNGKASQNTDKK